MEYYVYGHINPVTLKFFYIGKGRGRRSEDQRRNKFWLATVKKYGYVIVKIVDGLTNEQACEIEKQYIAKYGLRRNGGCLVNLTEGGGFGKTGYKMPEKERLNLSQRKRGNTIWLGRKHTDQTKQKIRLVQIGRVKSEEEIEKIRLANKGVKKSESFREKVRIGHLGLIPNEETRKKLSDSKRGAKNPNYGKPTWNKGIPRTEECKKKIRDTKAAKRLETLTKINL